MLPELSEIKNRRKRTGLTQSGLAAKTGVSQSLIAKIEAGAAIPSYDNAKRIFDFFESLHAQVQAKAQDFISSKVISASPETTLREAVRSMKKHAVSQLPVLEDGRNIGAVSERAVLEKLNSAEDMNAVSAMPVRELMEEAMPTVRQDSPSRVVSALLEHNPGVLVARNGKIVGIITKSDLLAAVLGSKRPKNANLGE